LKKVNFAKKSFAFLVSVMLICCTMFIGAPAASAAVSFPVHFLDLDNTEHGAGAVVHWGDGGAGGHFIRGMHPNNEGTYFDEWENATFGCKEGAIISRVDGANLGTVDITGADFIAMTVHVQDNGAWDMYKDNLQFLINNAYETSSNGCADVVPGKDCVVRLPLDGIPADALAGFGKIYIRTINCTDATLPLLITISDIYADVYKAPKQFLKLRGGEGAVVHPGGRDVANGVFYASGGYTGADLDGKIEYGNTLIFATNPTAYDFAGYDRISMYINVEDNGVWEEYVAAWEDGSSPITLNVHSHHIVTGAYPWGFNMNAKAVTETFLNVVPGKECKVSFDVSLIDFELLKAVTQMVMSFSLDTDDDLRMSVCHVYAEQSGNTAGEDVMIIDDENGDEYGNILSTGAVVAVGEKAYKANTIYPDGWVAFAGFYGAPALPETDISKVTNYGFDGALRFWAYVEDITEFADVNPDVCLIKLGDCDAPDGTNFVWNNWTNQLTKNGWNEVILPFANAAFEGSAPDATKIDTLYMKVNDGASTKHIYIDDMKVSANTEASKVLGDVTGDGEIDIRDLVNVKKFSASNAAYNEAYDFDADNAIDTTDLAMLRKVLIKRALIIR